MSLFNFKTFFDLLSRESMNTSNVLSEMIQDEYKYLYDVLLTWYMSNPEYREMEAEEVLEEEKREDILDMRGKIGSISSTNVHS